MYVCMYGKGRSIDLTKRDPLRSLFHNISFLVKKKPWFTKRKRKSTRKVPTSLIKRIDTVSISRIPYAEKNPRNSKGTL